jgi:para-aminobenzoate synthetase component 1
LAAGRRNVFSGSSISVLEDVACFLTEENDWLFGNIGYDFKNCIEPKLCSRKERRYGWEDVFFFCPETVVIIEKDCSSVRIECLDESPEVIFKSIFETAILNEEVVKVDFKKRVEKEDYLKTVERIRQHIVDGDCYEMNYCCEGFAEDVWVNPRVVFEKLNEVSPSPFAAFYKNGCDYLMCASPERYLMKEGNIIRSMPIKGTAKRGGNEEEDMARKRGLVDSEKDRAENVMIVDLVRSDLARSCRVGTVVVEELFGVYSFPQVHHLISTIKGELEDGRKVTDAICNSFPMGSMTGAPKVKVMELTEHYEPTRRGLFSGSVGYFSPNGDFDFNVVIRSLFYNEVSRYLSYETGGAITFDSVAEAEYEEMKLKAWALERVFEK